MGEEGAIVESPVGAAEPTGPDAAVDRDDSWLDDDGRDHGGEPSPALASAVWWCIGAGVMLLLPRQWASAGIAFSIAAVLALLKRRKYPPAPKKKRGQERAEGGADDEKAPRAVADA